MTRAPGAGSDETSSSQETFTACSNVVAIAVATARARSSPSHRANSVGPLPERLHPSAPASIAAGWARKEAGDLRAADGLGDDIDEGSRKELEIASIKRCDQRAHVAPLGHGTSERQFPV